MREVLADELAFEGHNDPFNLRARYTSAGVWCNDQSPDCISTMEDIFVLLSTEESRVVFMDLESTWEREPQAGMPMTSCLYLFSRRRRLHWNGYHFGFDH